MSPENTAKLSKKYHSLFSDYPLAPVAMFYFECEDGWYNLLDSTFTKLMALPVLPNIVQVKEKFGSLRIYCSGSDEAFAIVDEAEEASEHICELCGEYGTIQDYKGWDRCYCAACYEALFTKVR